MSLYNKSKYTTRTCNGICYHACNKKTFKKHAHFISYCVVWYLCNYCLDGCCPMSASPGKEKIIHRHKTAFTSREHFVTFKNCLKLSSFMFLAYYVAVEYGDQISSPDRQHLWSLNHSTVPHQARASVAWELLRSDTYNNNEASLCTVLSSSLYEHRQHTRSRIELWYHISLRVFRMIYLIKWRCWRSSNPFFR